MASNKHRHRKNTQGNQFNKKATELASILAAFEIENGVSPWRWDLIEEVHKPDSLAEDWVDGGSANSLAEAEHGAQEALASWRASDHYKFYQERAQAGYPDYFVRVRVEIYFLLDLKTWTTAEETNG